MNDKSIAFDSSSQQPVEYNQYNIGKSKSKNAGAEVIFTYRMHPLVLKINQF